MKPELSGYLFESYRNMANAYTSRRLMDEAKSAGIDLSIIGIHDSCIRDGVIYHAGVQVPCRAFAINRYKWGRVAKQLNACAARSYNPYAAHAKYVNKFEQLENLSSDYVLKPNSVLSTSMIDPTNLEQFLRFPFVAKGLESSQGREIFLIKDIHDLFKLRERFPIDKEWLFQEFIHQSYGRDMRFLVVRGNIEAGMTRTAQEDFRANVALGASVQALEPIPTIKRIAYELWEQSGLDFFGLDLLYGTEKPYFCEINVMPGLEGIESATGVNAAKKIIDLILMDHTNDLSRS